MSLDTTGTDRGIKITHEDDWGKKHVVEAHYHEAGTYRLALVLDGQEIYLSEGESGFFLAWMATWYGWGD